MVNQELAIIKQGAQLCERNINNNTEEFDRIAKR